MMFAGSTGSKVPVPIGAVVLLGCIVYVVVQWHPMATEGLFERHDAADRPREGCLSLSEWFGRVL